jgi:hypothetical protein
MKIETITYEAALERYPSQVADCLSQLRKSRSKKKKADPSTLDWCLEMCVMVDAVSMIDLFDTKPKLVVSLDEQVADYMSRTRTSLCGGGFVAAIPTPDFVGTNHRANLEKLALNAAQFDALSDDEKQASIQKLLKQLPGVRVFSIPGG